MQSEALKAANAGQGILNNGGRDDLIRGNLCVGWETCISSCDVSRSSSCSLAPLLPWRLGRSSLGALCQPERVAALKCGLCPCQCGLTWYATPSNYHNQLTTLSAGLKNPVYTERYPALAGLDSFLSLPLLGNCSKRKGCAPAPFGNTILGNAAVNASTAVELPNPTGEHGRPF